jgi:hypothetical protein
MPIPNITVTPSQFTDLQQNITDQAEHFNDVSDLAQSGLEIVVDLGDAAPEVDLLNPFAVHFANVESFESTSNFTQVVSALNTHVINRGTTPLPGEGLSDRLNRWLSDNSVMVTQTYANISSGAGFLIDGANIA